MLRSSVGFMSSAVSSYEAYISTLTKIPWLETVSEGIERIIRTAVVVLLSCVPLQMHLAIQIVFITVNRVAASACQQMFCG